MQQLNSELVKPSINLDSIAGTRDFPPDEMIKQNWLFNIWRSISKEFGYREYTCPIVEYADLYTRKGGDDVISEMFAFTLGNNKLALRPEMTPSLARLMSKTYQTEPTPFKWFSIPQCWRYEDIKRGRKREHYQWNVDVFGAEKVTSEIEIFMMIVEFFKRIGLTSNDVVLKVSNRMILQKVLSKMGIVEDLHTKIFITIDKINKMTRAEMSTLLQSEFDMKNEDINCIFSLCEITDINFIASLLGDQDETYIEMKKIFELAKQIGINEWLQFDASIVRGLSYYTGITFEGFPKNLPTLQKSLCGGGRYDDLMTTYGYKEKVPAVGFGFGDVVIMELLKDLNLIPVLKNETQYLVVSFNDDLFVDAVLLSQSMRANKINTETWTKSTHIKKAYDYANRKGIDHVILIAPIEWKNQQIVLKNLRENDPALKQTTLSLDVFMKSLI